MSPPNRALALEFVFQSYNEAKRNGQPDMLLDKLT